MKCPVCHKPAEPDHKPFCSDRCRNVDLARWFRGDYVVPGRDGEAEGLPPEGDERE